MEQSCDVRWPATQFVWHVDLVGATVVELIRKLNHGNKCCVMCADTIAQTRDSQQKFIISNVRLPKGSNI